MQFFISLQEKLVTKMIISLTILNQTITKPSFLTNKIVKMLNEKKLYVH